MSPVSARRCSGDRHSANEGPDDHRSGSNGGWPIKPFTIQPKRRPWAAMNVSQSAVRCVHITYARFPTRSSRSGMVMDRDESFQAWFDSLSDEHSAQAVSQAGQPLPSWMVVSLREARIAVIEVDLTDGSSRRRGQRMSTALVTFLESQRAHLLVDGLPFRTPTAVHGIGTDQPCP